MLYSAVRGVGAPWLLQGSDDLSGGLTLAVSLLDAKGKMFMRQFSFTRRHRFIRGMILKVSLLRTRLFYIFTSRFRKDRNTNQTDGSQTDSLEMQGI